MTPNGVIQRTIHHLLEDDMAKTIACRDMGADCDFVARGENLEELFKNAGEHGRAVHGMTEVTPEMREKALSLVRDE